VPEKESVGSLFVCGFNSFGLHSRRVNFQLLLSLSQY
jgi:hypothetical protein